MTLVTLGGSNEQTTPAKPDSLSQAIRNRRTIGAFTAEAVPNEIIAKCVELARWAPNHKRTEPWNFYLLGPETRAAVISFNVDLLRAKKGDEAAEPKRKQWEGVPGWLVVTSLRSDDAFLQEEDYAATCCAIQNLLLTLHDAGVATKWVTGDLISHPRFAELVGFSADRERVVALLWYGRPAANPTGNRKRDVAEILKVRP